MKTSQASLYDEDLARWSHEQAEALRVAAATGTNLPLDWEHLAEEIDSLGRSLHRELTSRLATVIEHLLRLELSEAVEPRTGWTETIQRERLEIDGLIEDNPSLRSALADSIAAADRKGRKLATLSLEAHGEWSPEKQKALSQIRFQDDQVTGSWLPEA